MHQKPLGGRAPPDPLAAVKGLESVDAHLTALEEQSCQISSWIHLWSFGLLLKLRPYLPVSIFPVLGGCSLLGWNDEGSGFYWRASSQPEQRNGRTVPDPKNLLQCWSISLQMMSFLPLPIVKVAKVLPTVDFPIATSASSVSIQ